MWVWVLTFTILGSKPEHGQIAKFATKPECQQALIAKKQESEQRGKELVGACYYTKINTK